ncbi:hypothetical protein FYK55_04980 [Roseiconus nitratireducens]|uniref:ATP synthase protein I n=1 Tax=Roseiconus nitratireducens TaxID=2605748 RepID=A0A5M6DFR2_9BACT|nr:AtpZ/AtpI family protein [Roseiconus nitratireducens]KAA5546243.1 hypothetical protein FYK55_04980 [Roseiconus nitratireducens]
MGQHATRFKRPDPRRAVKRDGERLARREKSNRHFWRSLSVIGMVGWPIAIGSAGGAWIGRVLDQRYDSGIHFTLMIMSVGLLLGCLAAWRTVVQKND